MEAATLVEDIEAQAKEVAQELARIAGERAELKNEVKRKGAIILQLTDRHRRLKRSADALVRPKTVRRKNVASDPVEVDADEAA